MADSQFDVLVERLDFDIAATSRHVRHLRNWTSAFKIGIMALGAGSTVLLGWHVESSQEHTIKNIALLLGAMITFLGGVSAFWNVENYWLSQKVVLLQLRDLRREIEFVSAGGPVPTGKVVQDFFDRYRALRDKRSGYWEAALGSRTPKTLSEKKQVHPPSQTT